MPSVQKIPYTPPCVSRSSIITLTWIPTIIVWEKKDLRAFYAIKMLAVPLWPKIHIKQSGKTNHIFLDYPRFISNSFLVVCHTKFTHQKNLYIPQWLKLPNRNKDLLEVYQLLLKQYTLRSTDTSTKVCCQCHCWAHFQHDTHYSLAMS